MKNFINTYGKQIKITLGILGVVLAYITFKHNLHLVSDFFDSEKLKMAVALDPNNLLILANIKYNERILTFYEKYFSKIALINFILFFILIMTFNIVHENPIYANIGIEAYIEIIVIIIEKQLHKY